MILHFLFKCRKKNKFYLEETEIQASWKAYRNNNHRLLDAITFIA